MQEDFIWLRCRREVQLARIVKNYRKTLGLTEGWHVYLTLIHGGLPLRETLAASDLISADEIFLGLRANADPIAPQDDANLISTPVTERPALQSIATNRVATPSSPFTPSVPRHLTKLEQQSPSSSASLYHVKTEDGSTLLPDDQDVLGLERDTNGRLPPLRHIKPETCEKKRGRSFSSQVSNVQREPSASLPEPVVQQKFQLQKLMQGKSLEQLEKAVTAGILLLDKLKEPLMEKSPEDAAQWIEQIDKVKK